MTGRLFGTNGVRGVANVDLTPELALRLGKAVGTWLPPAALVAVGRDARTTGPMFAAATTAGLLASGCRVVDLGVAPTPAFQYHVKTHDDVRAAIVVTASHNPPEFNGLKLVVHDGTEAAHADEAAVEALYESQAFRQPPWDALQTPTRDPSANDRYREAILSRVDRERIRRRPMKVVVDTGGGPGGLVTPRLLRDLGAAVVPLNEPLDGAFRGRKSEPTEDNLGQLKETVVREGAHLGLAHDGDADRCVFVDERGAFIPGDVSLALLARRCVAQNHGGLVCTPVSTSSLLEEVVGAVGGRVRYTAVGSPIVARDMIREKAVFGGEENGGCIFPIHQYCRDAAMTAAAMVELLSEAGRPLSELVAGLPRYHVIKAKFPVPDSKKRLVLGGLKAWVRDSYPKARVDETDGLKVYVDEGWVLIRPSGTEPIYRVFAESRKAEHAKRLAETFLKAGADLARS